MWPPKCSDFVARRGIFPTLKPFMSGVKLIYFSYSQRRQVRNKNRAALEKCGQAFAHQRRKRKIGWWWGVLEVGFKNQKLNKLDISGHKAVGQN